MSGRVCRIFLSYSNNKIYIITNNNNILDIYETLDNLNNHKILSLKSNKKSRSYKVFYLFKKSFTIFSFGRC